ncbi:MAG: DUF4038 domain-containing protein [Oscillospiraceae bacterium]|nr:DUF4038 domain-containing protein [Oscillospiraceae bacterium]
MAKSARRKPLAALAALLPLLPCFAFPAAAEDAVQQWRAHEIAFTAHEAYADPFNEVDLDVTFTGPGGAELAMPAFWDGGNTWKVRFAPTQAGQWRYESVCSNTADAGLHGVSGSFTCVPYAGELEIYRRGFLKTGPGVRHLMYADGTPFFYLGDTHWSMPAEPFEGMLKTIVDTRVAQGFTVYQSEPIGAGYDLTDGLTASDLPGFADLDRRFAYIADAGLVHANAQLIWAGNLYHEMHAGLYTESGLRRLSRYWVARYAAYPVLWTTAQEADNDFYYKEQQPYYDAAHNPWKLVAEAVGACDPYHHPLTAHQEHVGHTTASNSEFRKLAAHSWFGVQWSPGLNRSPDFAVPKDYWCNGGGKPAVNYEGRYENLWTKNFGARVQGWVSYLNGMYGYGYGAIDIWLYQSTYDIDTTSDDGVDKITPADKAVPWTESLYFETPGQLAHMKAFFEGMAWWELTPRFDSWRWIIPWQLTPWLGARYSLASDGNDAYVAYFYNPSRVTGLLRGLRGKYQAEWFNPRTGESTPIGSVKPFLGMYLMPCKPDKNDWVLYLRREV